LNTYLRFTIVVLVGMLTLVGCSRKKDSFINRNYHAMTTKFNTMYNGEVAFEKGRTELDASYRDNYWELLPVERIETFDDITRPGDSKNPNFERAEEKAVKAIQKHSMRIDGEEYNPQTDEAFIMLGKARYFEQRFIPALEAFNYVLAYYPTSNSIAQAKIWKEKTNIRLDNNELAITNLRKLLKIEENLDDQDIADASSMLAQAFMNLEIHDTALAYMKDAARFTRKNEERGRYNFIKGQLYNRLTHIDSADMAFDEVIALNRKIPRKYLINAHLEKTKHFDYATGDTTALLEFFAKLEKNRENRPFLDKIYYQKATFYQKVNNGDSAVALYNKSLRTDSQDRYLVSRDYLALGEYNFENAEYQSAGAYYDSTLGQLDSKSREYRRIKKKRDNLSDVLNYENLAQRNDSIVRLTKLSEEDLKSFFEAYIQKERERAIRDSIALVESVRDNEFFKNRSNEQQSKFSSLTNSSSLGGRQGGGLNQVGEFYFYNTTAASFGKQNFRKRWGNRKLEDDWRLSSKTDISSNGGVPNTIANATNNDGDSGLSLDDLLASVPRDEVEIDSLRKERDFAYYQLGLIYKEKFKEYPRAVDRLESLLTFDPEERLILPSKYNLYQSYLAMNANSEAEDYKRDIVTNHSDSRYAAILLNPEVALEQDASSPEAIYSTLFKKLETQEYGSLLEDLDANIEAFYGDDFVPKFELLKATVIGRYRGHKAYSEALNFVALTYPRSSEGKRAQELLRTTIPQLSFKAFTPDDDINTNWKLMFPFEVLEGDAVTTFKETLDEAFEALRYPYETSLDVYNEKQSFVVVHYITSKSKAEGLIELLKINDDYKITRPSMPISSENYKLVQIHKNLEEYIASRQINE